MTTLVRDADLRDELAVAADFLSDNGFEQAAEAVRVLYPRLPQSVLGVRRLIADMAEEEPDLSRWEFELIEEGTGSVLLLPVARATRRVETAHNDTVRMLHVRIHALKHSAAHDVRYGGLLRVRCDGRRTFETRMFDRVVMIPGDTLNLHNDVSCMDFLLPPEVVEGFLLRVEEDATMPLPVAPTGGTLEMTHTFTPNG